MPTPSTHPHPLQVLRVDASARQDGSVSRRLADRLIARLQADHETLHITHRDLAAQPPALIDAAWVDANFTPDDSRDAAQRAALSESDRLVAELQAADVLVISVPLYNFGIPTVLKAWVDLVARARLTFRYTDAGPEGLLRGKRAYVVFASGGVPAGSDVDFATGYIRHVLGFMGIDDVTLIAADQLSVRGEASIADAETRIATLFPAEAAGSAGDWRGAA